MSLNDEAVFVSDPLPPTLFGIQLKGNNFARTNRLTSVPCFFSRGDKTCYLFIITPTDEKKTLFKKEAKPLLLLVVVVAVVTVVDSGRQWWQ